MNEDTNDEAAQGTTDPPKEDGVQAPSDTPEQEPLCLKADGTIDKVDLLLRAVLPALWAGYVLYLDAKSRPGGINSLIQTTSDPAQAFRDLQKSITLLKETVNVARAS